MAQTLADEYHGHLCRNQTIKYSNALISFLHNDAQYIMEEEDKHADDLYIAGEITRAEWLMARERMGKWHG